VVGVGLVGCTATCCVVGAGVTTGAVAAAGVDVVLARVTLFLRVGLAAAGGVVAVVCGATVVGGVASCLSEDDLSNTPAA
jgi:hypothetical protein